MAITGKAEKRNGMKSRGSGRRSTGHDIEAEVVIMTGGTVPHILMTGIGGTQNTEPFGAGSDIP